MYHLSYKNYCGFGTLWIRSQVSRFIKLTEHRVAAGGVKEVSKVETVVLCIMDLLMNGQVVRMRRLLPLILLGLINDISMSSSFRYSRLAASPLIIYSGDDDHLHQLPGDRVTSSLLQKLASTSSGAVLPVPLRVGG